MEMQASWKKQCHGAPSAHAAGVIFGVNCRGDCVAKYQCEQVPDRADKEAERR